MALYFSVGVFIGLWMSTPPKLSLIEEFQALPDPRVRRTRDHELIDVLVIAVCTLLCGGESFNDMEDFGEAKLDWFKTFLALPNGIPSHDTFNRVFAALDPQEFQTCFVRWTEGPSHRRSWRWMARRCGGRSTERRVRNMWSMRGRRTTGWCWAKGRLNAGWDLAYLLRLLGGHQQKI